MRLRRKITIAFFGISALVAVLLALFLYRFIEDTLVEDLRARLDDIAHVGAHAIDLDACRRARAPRSSSRCSTSCSARSTGSPAARTKFVGTQMKHRRPGDQIAVWGNVSPA